MDNGIDRTKYMSAIECRQLRRHAQDRATGDLKAGRTMGVLAWMLVDTALSTGLRVSELARIEVEDIDVSREALSVTRSKKKKANRETLALNKELVKHLIDYLDGRTTGKLFVGSRGDLTAQGLQQVWRRAVKLAGLPKALSIHSARHTLAVALLKKTGNLRQVQKQLGHSSPTTTANMYADVSFDDMQAGLNGIYD